MTLSPETKKVLKEAGVWEAFNAMRMKLRDDDGLPPAEAAKKALLMYLPGSPGAKEAAAAIPVKPANGKGGHRPSRAAMAKAKPKPSPKPKPKPSPDPPKVKPPVEVKPETRVLLDYMQEPAKPPEPAPEPAPSLKEDDPARVAHLVGKHSPPAELIQWVAANLNGDPDIASCPGMDAWTLLWDCRKNGSLRADFWKSMYTRLIPNRATLDDELGDPETDGAQTLGVLDRIQRIASEAKGETPPEPDPAEDIECLM